MSVRLIHPDLPDQPVDVRDPAAIEIYERSGWRLEDPKTRPGMPQAQGALPEGQVVIYHPGLRQEVAVPAESAGPLRASGWMLKAEHEENERQAAEAAASKAKAPRAAASKEE